MGLLSGVAHGLGQVSGADEEDVHAFHLHHGFQILDGFDFFQHEADQGVAIGLFHVIGSGGAETVIGGAAAAEHAPVSQWMVLYGVNGGGGLFGGIHVGNLDAPRSPVHEGCDDFGLVADRTHDGSDAAEFGGPD